MECRIKISILTFVSEQMRYVDRARLKMEAERKAQQVVSLYSLLQRATVANHGTNGVNLQRGPKERDLAAKDRRQGVEVMVDVDKVAAQSVKTGCTPAWQLLILCLCRLLKS